MGTAPTIQEPPGGALTFDTTRLPLLLVSASDHLSGAGRWAVEAAQGLAERGFAVTLAAPPGLPVLPGVGLAVLDPDPSRDPDRYIRDRGQFLRLIERLHPALVLFSNGISPWAFLAASGAALDRGVPYVTVDHLLHPELFAGMPDQGVDLLRQRYLAAAAAVCVSRENLGCLRRCLDLPDDFGRVVVPGRPDRFFRPLPGSVRTTLRADLGLAPDALVCLTVAKLLPVKGHLAQLEGLARAMAAPGGEALQALWVGEGPLRPELETAIARKGLGGRVRLLGEREDVAELLAAADLFVLTSHAEGLPLSILEAMARGLPVLASAAGGVAEAVGDAGILLPLPAHRGELAGALCGHLLRLAADPAEREERGEAAAVKAEAEYRLDMMLESLSGLLRAAAG